MLLLGKLMASGLLVKPRQDARQSFLCHKPASPSIDTFNTFGVHRGDNVVTRTLLAGFVRIRAAR
jgi:hypothetical protein